MGVNQGKNRKFTNKLSPENWGNCSSLALFMVWLSNTVELSNCKVIYPKYSKHWPYTVAYTIDYVCSKMLNKPI